MRMTGMWVVLVCGGVRGMYFFIVWKSIHFAEDAFLDICTIEIDEKAES